MRYTFLLYAEETDRAAMTPADMKSAVSAFGAYIEALKQAGVFVDTDSLQPVANATTLSLQGGSRHVQDGPFAETKETLGGYFVIEVPDLDAALAWAEKCPGARFGKVEIRASRMSELR